MTPAPQQNPAIVWAMAAVDALVEAGLRDVVVSPGSRSTPLVAAVSADERLRDHSVIDERSAAFVALGLAQSTGRPVGLVCTSGTAAANYFPAICEAHHGHVPLVVMTADRPPRLRESGASQAMRQVGLYGGHVLWAHDVGMPSDSPAELRYVRSTARRAFAVARDEHGPVHLNFPFDKPLEPVLDAAKPEFADASGPVVQPAWRAPDPHAMTEVVRVLESAERPVFVVGSSRTSHRWARVLGEVARRIGAPILAEATSQLRFGEFADQVVPADLMMSHPPLAKSLRPDLVVRLGRPPINWPVIRWVDGLDAKRIVVAPNRDCDPEATADMVFVGDELAFLDALRRRLPDPDRASAWRQRVDEHGQRSVAVLHDLMQDAPLVDGTVAYDMAQLMPDGGALMLSSSMPLREFETFAMPRTAQLTVFCNRGLNGIDGVLSTAFGVAVGQGHPTALLIGDVAMAHDIGALQLARRLDVSLTAVIVDNGGGAIFDHLPVAGMEPMFSRHFTTPPELQWEASAGLFGVEATEVTDRHSFRERFFESLGQPGVRVIVVRTVREEARAFRDRVFREYGERVG